MLGDLRVLAAKRQVIVPATNTQMSATASLPNTVGKEFDLAWINQMHDMHEAKLSELKNVLAQTHDADIKSIATRAISKIRMHEEMLAEVMLSTESKPVHKSLRL
jgi:predicted outer membrane protein